MSKESYKGEQMAAQKPDYQMAFNNGELFLCECGELNITTAKDAKKGECFYCKSKRITLDKVRIKRALEKQVWTTDPATNDKG